MDPKRPRKPHSGGRGGARDGAGRPLQPAVADFRAYFRGKLSNPAERAWLWKTAKDLARRGNTTLLAKIIDKCEPTPMSITGDDEGGPILVKIIEESRVFRER